MTDTHETSADIIAEMRRRIAVKMSDAWYTQEEWRKLCDRLEAAWKRESGDCAKLRAALEKIAHYDDDDANMDDPYCADGHICADIARQALAAPPRNCKKEVENDD